MSDHNQYLNSLPDMALFSKGVNGVAVWWCRWWCVVVCDSGERAGGSGGLVVGVIVLDYGCVVVCDSEERASGSRGGNLSTSLAIIMSFQGKKLINDPNAVVTEFIEGLVETYPGLQYLDGFPEVKVVLRADVSSSTYNYVSVISGGGSGHEPAHAGFVGQGMLTAAICGDIFASPPVDSILAGIRAVTGPKGCLLIVKFIMEKKKKEKLRMVEDLEVEWINFEESIKRIVEEAIAQTTEAIKKNFEEAFKGLRKQRNREGISRSLEEPTIPQLKGSQQPRRKQDGSKILDGELDCGVVGVTRKFKFGGRLGDYGAGFTGGGRGGFAGKSGGRAGRLTGGLIGVSGLGGGGSVFEGGSGGDFGGGTREIGGALDIVRGNRAGRVERGGKTAASGGLNGKGGGFAKGGSGTSLAVDQGYVAIDSGLKGLIEQ
uniref:DhaK domain-containing protein n=1 Tax=Chenopodium quinoa TaxID=63459 RepID=A0A803N0W4_CHEQI